MLNIFFSEPGVSQPGSLDPGLVMVDGDQGPGAGPGPGVDPQLAGAGAPVNFHQPGQHEPANQVNFANEVGELFIFLGQ